MKSQLVIFLMVQIQLKPSLSMTSEKIAKIAERRRYELGRYRSTQHSKSDRVLIIYDGTDDEARQFGEDRGWKWNRKVLSRFEFIVPSSLPELGLDEAKKIDSKVQSVEYMELLHRVKKTVTVNDARWSRQWHLRTSQSPSMGVYNAWNKGYNGNGVTIAIVDDGMDITHSDLADNFVYSLAYDYIYDVKDPSHVGPNEGHGTSCAGVAAAVKNTVCVIGVAYQATLTAVRILDEYYSATSSDEAMALTHKLSSIDIYSNSWGPVDDGETFSRIPSVVLEALEKGVSKGRDGKGAIYTWASGNGGENEDDCNADGYASNMYTIAISAVSETTSPAYYAEHCSAILAATYSGDEPNQDITTTGPSDTCINDFSGTSSACPVASGIIALTLQANPDLTWRDVQHMIVETSTSSGLDSSAGFYTNGRGKEVSEYFGFGLMNAEEMVDNAPAWNTVPSRTSCSYPDISVQRSLVGNSANITSSYNVTNCFIAYLEHVIVTISYKAKYRGGVEFYLQSPSGTLSKIFRSRSYDYSKRAMTWDFMSVLTWGEDPDGVWTLTMADVNGSTVMHLYDWGLKLYGTITDPLAGEPTAGTYGGACSKSSDCSSLTDGGCLEDGLLCVNCSNGYRVIGKFCKQDGRLAGYCDTSISCFNNKLECVQNICVTSSDDEKDNTALIVGVVVAGVILIAVVCFIIFKKCFAAKATASVAPSNSGPPTSVNGLYSPASGQSAISSTDFPSNSGPSMSVNGLYSSSSVENAISSTDFPSNTEQISGNRILLPPLDSNTLPNPPPYPASEPPPYTSLHL